MRDPNSGGEMHSSNLTVQIWREADEGIGVGQGALAPEFLGEVTARVRRRIEAAVRPRKSSGRRLDVADAFPHLAEHVDQAA
jgi:hypothetical protein